MYACMHACTHAYMQNILNWRWGAGQLTIRRVQACSPVTQHTLPLTYKCQILKTIVAWCDAFFWPQVQQMTRPTPMRRNWPGRA